MSEYFTDGNSAFPHDNARGSEPGMTLRDYFASKALASLICADKDHENRGAKAVPTLAKWAYEYADAMLKERAK